MRRALVLSGGGMFGAWQAGAWAALSGRVEFDLIVGASVGALNGYAIACGASPAQLRELWLNPAFTRLGGLAGTVERLMHRASPKIEFAVAVTELAKMKPRVFRGAEVRAQHLVASCALPLIRPPVRIDGRLYTDGGLLNTIPTWAAIQLGATHILGLNVLPRIPSLWLGPIVRAFQAVAGYRVPQPPDVTVQVLRPAADLGSLRQALSWDRQRIERWLDQGQADVTRALGGDEMKKTFSF